MPDDGFDIDIYGLEEIDDRLNQYSKGFAKMCVQRGVAAGGAVLKAAAAERAPVMAQASPNRQPGELRDSIDFLFDADNGNDPSRVGGTISPMYDRSEGWDSPGVWGKFVEYGSVHGPAQPFMRPAVDEEGMDAIDVCIAETGAAMDELPEAPEVAAA